MTGPVLAVDLGGRRIKVAAVDGPDVLALRMIGVEAEGGLRAHLHEIDAALAAVAAEVGGAVDDAAGIGLAVPGLVDRRAATVRSANAKYPDAVGFDFSGWAEQRHGLPLLLENDAHAAMLGEWRHGAARGTDDAVLVALGTGIGCSVVVDGRPLRGRGDQAGLLGGHLVVEIDGRPCTCPNRGCAEAEASTWALPGLAADHPGLGSSALAAEPVIDYESVFRLARAGDAVARHLEDRSLAVWSAMTVSLVHAFAPQRVVFGGGVLRASDRILPAVGRAVGERAWVSYGDVEVVVAEHLDTAALLGAGVLVLEAPVPW